jgi:hypothetical protein
MGLRILYDITESPFTGKSKAKVMLIKCQCRLSIDGSLEAAKIWYRLCHKYMFTVSYNNGNMSNLSN